MRLPLSQNCPEYCPERYKAVGRRLQCLVRRGVDRALRICHGPRELYFPVIGS